MLTSAMITILILAANPRSSYSQILPQKPIPRNTIEQSSLKQRQPPTGRLKGWDYLVAEIVKFGLNRDQVERHFTDAAMPERGFIPFAAAPKETHDLYKGLITKKKLIEARACFQTNKDELERIASKTHVPAKVLSAVMFVETGCGKYLGENLVFVRLARLAGLSAPDNVQWNYERLLAAGEKVTFEQITHRAQYLKETFLEQLPALISLSDRAKIDPFNFKGSPAGAFGIPQFLPLSLVKYGTDGNGDHKVDLNTIPDAAASIATFLTRNGWEKKMTKKQKMAVLFTYNRSEPYGATVLRIADNL